MNMSDSMKKFMYLMLACLAALAVYLVYLTVWRGPILSRDDSNPRTWILENRVVRGGIFARGGEKIVESIGQDNQIVRHYLFGAEYAQITGYDTRRLGKVGLEKTYNNELLGLKGSLWKALQVRWGVKGVRGNDLYLTIDSRLQDKAWQMMAPYKGSVVVLNPKTGEILAMVSTPSYDPNPGPLDSQWSDILKNPNHPLLNKAAMGLYPPGSTMKIATASIGLKKFPQLPAEVYNCQGEIKINGRILKDLHVHGQVNMDKALNVSCNTYFATLGMRIGVQDFASGLTGFGWGKDFPFDLPYMPSPLYQDSFNTPNGLAEAAIGQGKILVTPLFMAMVAGSIGNDGVMMRPYLVGQIKSTEGQSIWSASPQVLAQTTTPEIASRVRKAMIGVVDNGTGTAASLPGIEVAGKTGSAENPEGDPHAWFVSFAPAKTPQVAVCVMIEHGGQGGRVAAPIARELMRLALTQGG
jgi:peptidoglycan glycosyltransferase